MTWHHDHDDLTRALRDEARADAARPVPPLVQRALADLPARDELPAVHVLPDVRPSRPWRAAAALLVCGAAVTAALLWPDAQADRRAEQLALQGSAAPVDDSTTTTPDTTVASSGAHRPSHPATATSDDATQPAPRHHRAAAPTAQWVAAVPLAPLSPDPALTAARQGPPTMVHRLFHPRLPDPLPAWAPLKRPVARVQAAASGAGVRVQAHVASMLARLLWPLRQALTPLEP